MTVPMSLLILLAAQVAPVAPVPPAQPPATIVAEPAALMIAACDANGDAVVTQPELTACIARSFVGAPDVVDGRMGYIAYADWALRWLGDRNALPSPYEVDANGDNAITLPELQARFAGYFRRFDVDHDGRLTRAELVTIRARAAGVDGARPRRKR